MNFIKMHGLGNDFVLLDARAEKIEGSSLPQLARELCDRHFGVGADGVLIVHPSAKAEYRLQIINPDGSEPEMCGNGLRCFAKYVYEKDKLTKDVVSIETIAGIKVVAIIAEEGIVSAVEVDMGEPKDEGELKFEGFRFRKINMGNPHAVAIVSNLDQITLAEIGPIIELSSHFPNRTNVEFVKIISDSEIEVLVWERGAGETLACGTGASASVVAASLAGKVGRSVKVNLPGGTLKVEWQDDNHVLMTGPAEAVFEGKYYL
ncbi:diaminopimelate epimerase [Candidatus Saganbacteria bacterium]|nr:diaminopimelate epimerase [Candidatus Saganbacteria bacterium]